MADDAVFREEWPFPLRNRGEDEPDFDARIDEIQQGFLILLSSPNVKLKALRVPLEDIQEIVRAISDAKQWRCERLRYWDLQRRYARGMLDYRETRDSRGFARAFGIGEGGVRGSERSEIEEEYIFRTYCELIMESSGHLVGLGDPLFGASHLWRHSCLLDRALPKPGHEPEPYVVEAPLDRIAAVKKIASFYGFASPEAAAKKLREIRTRLKDERAGLEKSDDPWDHLRLLALPKSDDIKIPSSRTLEMAG